MRDQDGRGPYFESSLQYILGINIRLEHSTSSRLVQSLPYTESPLGIEKSVTASNKLTTVSRLTRGDCSGVAFPRYDGCILRTCILVIPS